MTVRAVYRSPGKSDFSARFRRYTIKMPEIAAATPLWRRGRHISTHDETEPRNARATPGRPSVEPTSNTELLLMYAARRQHMVQTIQPALDRGVWVITDRFEDSSFAYQAGAGGASWEACQQLSKWALNGFEPTLTFLFDLPIAVSQARIQGRAGDGDKFEAKPGNYFEAVRAGFIKRAQLNPRRIRVIDAQPSEAEVGEAVLLELDKFMRTHLNLGLA